jgi:hypothetical protein
MHKPMGILANNIVFSKILKAELRLAPLVIENKVINKAVG